MLDSNRGARNFIKYTFAIAIAEHMNNELYSFTISFIFYYVLDQGWDDVLDFGVKNLKISF